MVPCIIKLFTPLLPGLGKELGKNGPALIFVEYKAMSMVRDRFTSDDGERWFAVYAWQMGTAAHRDLVGWFW